MRLFRYFYFWGIWAETKRDGKTRWCCVQRIARYSCTVRQNIFFIEQSASHICRNSKLIRPSLPIMAHSLDRKVLAGKAKARKCRAKIAGNVQAKVERQHRLVTSFSVTSPARSNSQRCNKLFVISHHDSAGMMSPMRCKILKSSPAPADMFAQNAQNCFSYTLARLHQMWEGNLHLANHPGKNTAQNLWQKIEERESCLQNTDH